MDEIKIATGSMLDRLALYQPVTRMVWMEEPTHLDKTEYFFDQKWDITGTFILSNFSESNASLRERIKGKLKQ